MYVVTRSDDMILHYGVKGMKWGVRHDKVRSAGKKVKNTYTTVKNNKKVRSTVNRYRNLTGSKRSAALKKYRSKNIDGMSDKDLRAAVNRMNLERQYRDLTKVDMLRGQKAAKVYLTYKGTATAVGLLKKK